MKATCIKNMKALKYQLIIPLLIFIVGIAALAHLICTTYTYSNERIRTLAKLNAVTYGDQIIWQLTEGTNVTDALDQIVISSNGNVGKFDQIAAQMVNGDIQCIQLAPGGVVTQVYPLEGNEDSLIDLFHDEIRRDLACYSRDHHITLAVGPIALKEGGDGIVIRNPVYLTDDNGQETFWGFTNAIFRTPDIFSESTRALTSFGYVYRLSKTLSPFNSKYELVDGSADQLDNPVVYTFQLGGCLWKLEVMPAGGWHRDSNIVIIFCVGLVLVLLATGLSFTVLVINHRKKILKQLSVTDSLTGLLNRHGFHSAMEKYLRTHLLESCVGITFDIDDFKFINDMYGHAAGDNALQQLAQNMKTVFPKQSFLARCGGDEFSVFLTDCTRAQAAELVEQFLLLPRSFCYEDEQLTFNISLGYAVYPEQASTAADLFAKADTALYEVKLRGKNNYLAYESGFSHEKRSQLGFALKDVSDHLPTSLMIYKADPEDDRILFANYELIHLTGCDNLDDLLHHSSSCFHNLITPEARDDITAAILEQLRSGKYGTDTYIEFPLLRKDGSHITVFSHGRIGNNNYYGTIIYVLITTSDALREQMFL